MANGVASADGGPSERPQRLNPGQKRMLYLHQAAALMARSGENRLATYYNECMANVAKKTVQRLGPEVKSTVCRRCHAFLLPGHTSTLFVENLSRRQVPHADVLVVKCRQCGTRKNYARLRESRPALG